VAATDRAWGSRGGTAGVGRSASGSGRGCRAGRWWPRPRLARPTSPERERERRREASAKGLSVAALSPGAATKRSREREREREPLCSALLCL
jgi:hypothetical protein